MEGYPEVAVLRLGHRPGRDERMTTHVGLTARALGADRVVFEAGGVEDAVETAEDVTDRFGGPFAVERTDRPRAVLRDWPGTVVHLTMYGEPVQDALGGVRADHRDGRPVLAVVGAGKVPFAVYEAADRNLAVTNQPHSEVAALAVFLDRLFEGAELDREWVGADRQVVPAETGKRVEPVDDPAEGADAEDPGADADTGTDGGSDDPDADADGRAGSGTGTGDGTG